MLREGSNGWYCSPDALETPGPDPWCYDQTWLDWVYAWLAGEEPNTTVPGLAYKLQGSSDPSNTDPFATEPAAGEAHQGCQRAAHVGARGAGHSPADRDAPAGKAQRYRDAVGGEREITVEISFRQRGGALSKGGRDEEAEQVHVLGGFDRDLHDQGEDGRASAAADSSPSGPSTSRTSAEPVGVRRPIDPYGDTSA